MADGSKVRLVRCPKCDNLLTELPEYSVYQCGGCGTILRAKKKNQGSDVLSEKSEEEKGFVGSSERLVNSVIEMEDCESDNSWRSKERVFVEKKTNFVNSAFQRPEKKEVSVRDGEFGSVDRCDRFSEPEGGRYASGGINRPQALKSSVEETTTRPGKVVGSLRTRPRMDWSSVERDRHQFEGLYGSHSSVSEFARKPNAAYTDVAGPSNYDPYVYGGRSRGNVPGEVEKLEHERAELIRKLDELKEQLGRSYPEPAVPKEREPLDRNFPHSSAATMGTQPYGNRHNVDAMNFYSLRTHNLNKIPEYEDSFQPQMTRQAHYQQPYQYSHVSPHEYYPGQYKNFDHDPYTPYPQESFFHAPNCSCSTCYPRVPPPYNRGPVNHNSNFYRHDDPVMVELQRRTTRPIDLDSEIDSRYHRPRMTPAEVNNIGRCCHPIAGGAPFILCLKCFELLKLPTRKLRATGINKKRVRCGACSTVILLKVENEKLVASLVMEPKHTSAAALNDNSVKSSSSLDANSCSEDFRISSFNFQSVVSEHRSLGEEEEERLNLDEPEKGLPSSPSTSSREEENTPSAIARDDVSEQGEVEFPFKTVPSPVAPRSPMWQESNERTENERDDNMIGRINYRDDLVRDLTTEATELDVSFDEYQHNNMSHDFAELSKEDYRLRLSKGSDSFLVGFIKKSLRDISRSGHSMEAERPKVYINGHPLLDRVVKRAEKFAGPIRPGDYWYDSKAGFWGVMGQSCLGIIPPGIEEFNFPMPTNCGAGNTSVYVNGRELNQRDLDLLASRGLPTTRNKFFIVEISGKVIDEDTGKELDNLGKLAPTVERVKHGFGMKAPRSVS